jgi:plastocyanin
MVIRLPAEIGDPLMTTTTIARAVTGRQALSALAKWTVAALVAGTLLLVYLQVFRFRAFMPPVALMFGVPALILAALVAAVRRPWAPLLGTLYSVLFLGANGRYVAYDLAHPESFSNFSFSVVLLMPALLGAAAGMGAAVQNYRAVARAAPEAQGQRIPRWFSHGLTALAALGLGAILVAAIAPAGASAGVSAETLAALPALTAAQHHFDQAELRARVGETIALRLENQDAAGHSFDIDELGIHVSMPPDKPALALFKASTPGTYAFYCAIPGHREAGMAGTLIVEP